MKKNKERAVEEKAWKVRRGGQGEEGKGGEKKRRRRRRMECGRESRGLVFQTGNERKTCGLDRRSCATTIPTEIRYQQAFFQTAFDVPRIV